MTKNDIASAIAEKTGLTKKDALAAISAYSEVILDEVKKGEKFTIPDIGSISVKDRPARTVRNPRTGESMETAACKIAKMSFVKKVKDAING